MSDVPFDVAVRLERLGHERPSDEALSDLRTTLTYRELVERAAGVAEWVAERRGTSPVVVLVDLSVDSVVALLGVLWAGRGVLPLDVNDPAERVAQLARLAAADLVIDATSSDSSTVPAAVPGLAVHRCEARRGVASPAVWEPSTIASIHVTSGSGGTPKAVVRTFAQLNGYCESSLAHPHFAALLRTALFMPLHFAGGFTAMLFGLAAGRYVALVDARRLLPADRNAFLLRHRIERLHLTPSLARSFAASGTAQQGDGSLRSVREAWLTGEALQWADVGVIRSAFASLERVLYVYAASEATSLVTAYVIESGEPLGSGRVPLGREQNASGLRLDAIEGRADVCELVVLGEVSEGYLNDPALTATRFGTDSTGVRFWRTGDLVSRDTGGLLHHLGRLDDMVKINGRLVEPAESERVLGEIPGVNAAVVIPRTLPSGRQQMIAHVEAAATVSANAVRSELVRRLPAYLVPAILVRHDALPLTDRGKVDRAALRSMTVKPWREAGPATRADRLVELVCATAARVLGLEDVDPDTDLWDLGCDSLSAIELVTALTGEGEEKIRADDLLTSSTCRQLAEILREEHARSRSEVIVIREQATGRPTYLLPGGGGFALSYKPLLMEFDTAGPVVVYEQRGLHRRGRRDRTIAAAARRNLQDLTERQPRGPYVIVGHSWGGLVGHEMARELHDAGHEVRLVLLDSARSPSSRHPAPENIRVRRDPFPSYAAKFLVWKLAVMCNAMMKRARRISQPIGSVRRYDAFFDRAVRSVRQAHIEPLDVPILLVHVVGSLAASQWDDHPNVTKVLVGGEHLSMLRPPHVADVGRAIDRFITSES